MSYQEMTLKKWIEEVVNEPCTVMKNLPLSGSNRRYIRVFFASKNTLIGVYNEDIRENEAFFYWTRVFAERGIRVPKLLNIDHQRQYYLLEDLGDETLYSFLTLHRHSATDMGEEVKALYEQAVEQLPRLQTSGKNADFSRCYPRPAFDKQSMQWDLNYFKYYFLKLAGISFDEQKLENDFNTLIQFLLQTDSEYFLYRDFQSRNLMIRDGNIYFIDYQGGRKGALQYDIASLLYDAKANLPPSFRAYLLERYLNALEQIIPVRRKDFLVSYPAFVLIRVLQSMGTYGFRGYYERKAHFLQSIPYAIRNIASLLEQSSFRIHIPELQRVLTEMVGASEWSEHGKKEDILTVHVGSFSYKKGIPANLTAHGGGFVFDCRSLPNPGREMQYQQLSGKDMKVIQFMEKHEETHFFKSKVFAIADHAVENYLTRNFNYISILFGCTGGQHRSVYFAESMAKHLQEKYPAIQVKLKHENEVW
ncbi:MAG: phosphotransferase [Bacteroidales bacterium]|jgi:aminoglycoside/choline kinase family phosphotransferase|nr:phosphotransferase [Bacteroidales bacterium]